MMKKDYKTYLLIIVIGFLFFVPFLGQVHLLDWDEINFAEAAREMIVTGDYLSVRIDYEPFHEKPPLFIWLQVISMKIFGINEFAARFPNAMIGIITLLFAFRLGKKFFDEKFGLLWVLAFIGSFLPHFYFKTGIIDPTFNLFIFASMYYISELAYKQINSPNQSIKKELLLAGVFNSLAVLTKGPVGFLLVFLAWFAFWIIKRKNYKFPIKEMIIFGIISALPIIIWYILLLSQIGGDIINDFILYQLRLLTTGDAGHEGPIYYHLIPLFIGCFPASIFVLRALRHQADDSNHQDLFRIWNIILLSVVIFIFSIVKTKILHYSSLAYFPITFLAAYSMFKINYHSLRWKISSTIFVWVIGIILALGLILFPLILMNISLFLPQITDKFTNAILQTPVEWYGFEQIAGFILLIGLAAFSFFIYKRNFINAFISLFSATAITIMVFLPLMTPKIETFLQGTPIEFYKEFKGTDAYIHTLGYKSYAPFFYTEKPMNLSRYYHKMHGAEFEEWLLAGNIDKDAYFVSRINNYENYTNKYPNLKIISIKNGYVFLKREND